MKTYKTYTCLTKNERDQIQELLKIGKSIYKISKILNRHISSIIYELKKYSLYDNYYSNYATLLSKKERLKSKRKLVISKNKQLENFVINMLAEGWTPEQIEGWLKRVKIKDFYCCTETIYSYIYSDSIKSKEYYLLLPKRHKSRKFTPSKKVSTLIKGFESIHTRPNIVNENIEFGHYEIDCIESTKLSSYALLVFVEKTTKKVFIKKITKMTSELFYNSLKEIINSLPKNTTKSITFDCGKENRLAYLLHSKGIKTYFCDPSSPWQKGLVENTNSLIRRVYKKGTDFAHIPKYKIKELENKLNNRPRKTLNFLTPNMAWDKMLC